MSKSPSPFQILWRKLPAPLRNKYLLTLLVFTAMLIFLDKHDLYTQWKLRGSVERLERDRTWYQEKIQQAKMDQESIETDKEKFAREKYHMHKGNEDVFIIEKEK